LEGQRKSTSVRTVFLPPCKTDIFICSCFGHVVNIANVAVMGRVTQIAAIENATAIWEYDPSLPGNRILGGSLDVIAAIRTIAVKVSLPYFLHYNFLINFSDPGIWPAHRILREAPAAMQVSQTA
jgi:hypothetical protein